MALAREERLTWADLKAMLAKADPNARAVLNPSVGRARTLEILAAAAAEKAVAEIADAVGTDQVTWQGTHQRVRRGDDTGNPRGAIAPGRLVDGPPGRQPAGRAPAGRRAGGLLSSRRRAGGSHLGRRPR